MVTPPSANFSQAFCSSQASEWCDIAVGPENLDITAWFFVFF